GLSGQDTISRIPLGLGAYWGRVQPFVMASCHQFRLPPPPALNSPDYTAAYNDAKRLRGDGIVTPTARTPEQTSVAVYWAYDGTPSLCAPSRLYNQLAGHLADQMNSDALE